ncbi:hypothetical protein C0992_000602 [Termitomyces sp. T32_za158]|nr:hypothetical protein C0992_000602 [Termitomyces sp. T32_za158]
MFVAQNPNTIYGLAIPHDVTQIPVLRKVANFPGDHHPAIAIGLEKVFVAFERNWTADRDKLSGSVIRLNVPRTEDERSSEVVAAQGVHSYDYPAEWYVGWPPLLDEGSGRIVQFFGELVEELAHQAYTRS